MFQILRYEFLGYRKLQAEKLNIQMPPICKGNENGQYIFLSEKYEARTEVSHQGMVDQIKKFIVKPGSLCRTIYLCRDTNVKQQSEA